MANGAHEWKLVAPWYRWERQRVEEGREPRRTRPVFQKFDSPDFVKTFVRDPQKSLRFKEDVDRVFNINKVALAKLAAGPFAGRFARMYKEGTTAFDTTLVPTGIRKLFLDTHKRHYLVVAELHCDAAGFPRVNQQQVCQAGFAVRRRSHDFPKGAKKEAAARLKEIVAIQAEIAYLRESAPFKGTALRKRTEAVAKLKAEGQWAAKLAATEAKLAAARQELKEWKNGNGVVSVYEGWIDGEFKNIGSWQIVEETPQEIREATYPMYPLFPDPRIDSHDAKGKTIYYGVLPSSSLDTDGRGTSRYDDQSLYEIRCFVRRHKPGCPRGEAPDCRGEVFWSEPTEVYMLASQNDLMGTAQRPVTIQMPNLAELAAQAAALPVESLAPAKVVQPQPLNFDVSEGKAENASVGGGGQICFFAIPLITIVAFFVFKLFLPVVVLLFGLFFLLSLKLCIPPSFQISAGLDAQLEVLPPSIDVDAEFDVSLGLPFTATDLNNSMAATIKTDVGMSTADLSELSNAAMLPTGKLMVRASGVTESTIGPDLTASLEYEPRVELTT